MTGIDERGAVERRGAPERDRRGQNRHDQPQFGNWNDGNIEIKKIGTPKSPHK